MNFPMFLSATDAATISGLRDEEDKRRERQAALDAIAKARGIYSQLDAAASKDAQATTDRYNHPNNLLDELARSGQGMGFAAPADTSVVDEIAKKYGGSRDAIAANLGLKDRFAAMPEVQAFNKENEADKGRSFSNTVEFDKTLDNLSKAGAPIWAQRPDLKPNFETKSPREIAGQYGFTGSATPEAKEAMTNVEQEEKAAEDERLKMEAIAADERQKEEYRKMKDEELASKQKFDAEQAEKDRQNRILRSQLVQSNKPPQSPDAGKPMSADASKTIGLISNGIQGAQDFRNALLSGDADFWATTLFGGFTNPKANIAYEKARESLGRLNSGGAITKDEETRFGRLIADKRALTTKEGRAAIAEELGNFIDRGRSTGDLIYGGSGWQTKFGVVNHSANDTKVINGVTYKKVNGGWQRQ